MSESKLLAKLEELRPLIGGTPVRSMSVEGVACYSKLEYNNFTGSIKDRAVFNILYQGVRRGLITDKTTLIESSSGNFAISIATIANFIGLKFVGVIDPNINRPYEDQLKLLAHRVIKVQERDETGGYLLNRIRAVTMACADDPNYFWTDQYENPDNFHAYFGLADEIASQLPQLDYAFIAVSTCGTIKGLSIRLKELYPSIRIVGVDIEGSLVFQNEPRRRHISGLGSSKRPKFIDEAKIDSFINVSHAGIVEGCWKLMRNHSMFTGGSTGAMYSAVCEYIARKELRVNQIALFLSCDRGNAYLDTIFNREWVDKITNMDLVSST